MKFSFVCLSLAAIFAGCVSNIDPVDDESEPEETPYVTEAPGGLGYPGEGFSDPCRMVTLHEFTMNGETYTVALPVMCDPNPFQDRGDPPPDSVTNPGDIYENPSDQHQDGADPNEDSSTFI